MQTLQLLKPNAYGHGAVAVAKHLSKQVDGFCVSSLDEKRLRQAGLEQPILILGVVLPDRFTLAYSRKHHADLGSFARVVGNG